MWIRDLQKHLNSLVVYFTWVQYHYLLNCAVLFCQYLSWLPELEPRLRRIHLLILHEQYLCWRESFAKKCTLNTVPGAITLLPCTRNLSRLWQEKNPRYVHPLIDIVDFCFLYTVYLKIFRVCDQYPVKF